MRDGAIHKHVSDRLSPIPLPDVPFLGYIRRGGWVVIVPYRPNDGIFVGSTRPCKLQITRMEILAVAPLPSVPESVG